MTSRPIEKQKKPAGSSAAESVVRPEIGLVEWFWINDVDHVEKTLAAMRQLGIRHLRTACSWADWFTPHGEEWYRWLLPRLAEQVEILPCILYTPPSIGVYPSTAAPPREPKAYADFVDQIITLFGKMFDYIELWNEPNNRSEWDYTKDKHWYTFGEMVGGAAYWARRRGKKTVLAGMSPIDPNWVSTMIDRGVMEYIDVVGVHGFPGLQGNGWEGWQPSIEPVQKVLQAAGCNPEIWVTETGCSTWRHGEYEQVERFIELMKAPARRVYWYTMYDLNPERPTVDGFHTDEREYHFGLKETNHRPKLLFRMWEQGGLDAVHNLRSLHNVHVKEEHPSALVTGGAGFIGTNLARRLLEAGRRVTVLDNLSRPGVEKNLRWLKDGYGDRMQAIIGDVRDRHTVHKAVRQAEEIYHFAAQVAVTTSLDDPIQDFDVNLGGTVNLLEEIRNLKNPPPLLFTSTNKVYGGMEDVPLQINGHRYEPLDDHIRSNGINEQRTLEFNSPYGCSKGAADQYILDYSRSYGLKTGVLRMSCIYGPHQLGTTHQGWVAFFVDQVIKGNCIMIYGDGMQVRDLLFIDDLVEAFLLARKHIDDISGQAFNIGGGPSNSISLLELIEMLTELHEAPHIEYDDWRQGDQRYYVSDTGKFRSVTGWSPQVDVKEGVRRLYEWLNSARRVHAEALQEATV